VTGVRVLLMTAPSAQVAEEIVSSLVNERLIACGNITVPVSIYRWQGALERANEVLVIMKTLETAVAEVTRRIGELHPYEVPEVLSLQVSAGNQAYLSWVDESVE
jgi:periplasmic divalent cation tolerance protein